MKKSVGLTPREQELYDYLKRHVMWRLPAPSDICKALGLSDNSDSLVWNWLKNLEKKGYIISEGRGYRLKDMST